MAVAFSSNDTNILDRDDGITDDDLILTPHNEIYDTYEIEKCIKFIQVSFIYIYSFLFLQLDRSFQEVIISDFFSKTNAESPFQHQNGIKKKPREKGSLKK